MEISEARKIIGSVAEGINPFTGEVFPPDSIYQHPQLVRALYRAAEVLEAREKWELRKSKLPDKAGKPWSEEEDRQLAASYDAGKSIDLIAREHQRTRGSIELRLEKLGRLERIWRPRKPQK